MSAFGLIWAHGVIHAARVFEGHPAGPGARTSRVVGVIDPLPARHKVPAAIDNRVKRTYLPGMLVRVLNLFAIVALAVFTIAASAHVARASDTIDHSLHSGAAAHTLMDRGDGHFDLSDQGACDLICSGHAYCPPSPDEDVTYVRRAPKIPAPAGVILAGQSGAVSERPPKLRLL